jgi:hypothetical protein
MAQMLLLNPAKRRRARKGSPKRRRATTARRRRRNPVSVVTVAPRRVVRRAARRRNPAPRVIRRAIRGRRRNPISLGMNGRTIASMLKEALIGGAGALAMDAAMGQVNGFLPATLQRVPGQPGVGDAVKALLTIVLSRALAKPTKGLSVQAGKGALVVQAYGLLAGFMPAGVTMGYAVPGQVVQGQSRVSPNRLARYTQPGVTPLIASQMARYTAPGVSPMLGGTRERAMTREGVRYR